jgi:pimeloyl-ACP methyl ester carboxylesterase
MPDEADKHPMDDVIVLLPGITGSVLQKDGKDVWALTPSAARRALLTLGHDIGDLELPSDDKDDGVEATELMPDLHLIPGLWKIDGYGGVRRFINDTFDVTLGRNYFEFPYDWRRDNRIHAKRLKEESRRWLGEWRKDHPQAKLILVGHSMGGLISRYFLECLEGWRDARALVTFGTPHRGSLNALDFLVNGLRKGFGPVTLLDLSKLVRSFTSVYQLLPIFPAYRPGPGQAMVHLKDATGLPHVDLERVKAADEFHREIERAVSDHLTNELYVRHRYRIHSIVGTYQPTSQSAEAHGGGIRLLEVYDGEDLGGDGTVPRVSATPIEFEHEEGAMFGAELHASLQNFQPALVHLDGVLTGRDTSRFRPVRSKVGLDIEDLYETTEPIAISVRSADPEAELVAVVTDASTEEEVRRAPVQPTDAIWWPAELPPLASGTYRMRIEGGKSVEPVTDLFVVADPGEEGS